mmetsp:Transcript_139/g.1085  ORF Transcript_139/g.1085 Transcript_139/m.1085 type:complete len:84 (-) Transcript_139:1817-2068(-)
MVAVSQSHPSWCGSDIHARGQRRTARVRRRKVLQTEQKQKNVERKLQVDQQGHMDATVVLYVSESGRDRDLGRNFNHMHAKEL